MRLSTNYLIAMRLTLLIAVFFTLTSMAPHRANFSGYWRLNEAKSVRGNTLCIYDQGDRMRANTMKISEHADFLTIDIVSSSSDMTLVTRRENLTFGKESEVTLISRGKKFTTAWSDDGQTMTVNSTVYLDIDGEKQEFKVTEVWRLINDGKSISLQANATSTFSGERTWKFVYDKVA